MAPENSRVESEFGSQVDCLASYALQMMKRAMKAAAKVETLDVCSNQTLQRKLLDVSEAAASFA